jgi:Na+/proline symporter
MQGTVVSTVFALVIGFGAYFTGALSGLFPDVIGGVSGDNVIPTLLASVIPAGLMGVIAVLILSASMSTLSSVSLASASVVAVDLYKGAVNPRASDRRVNATMKGLCLVFVAISVILAVLNEELGITAIAYMMGLSWGTLAGCFMGPYVLGVLWRGVTRAAAWASIISSLTLTAVLTVVLGYAKCVWSATVGQALAAGVSCSPMIILDGRPPSKFLLRFSSSLPHENATI